MGETQLQADTGLKEGVSVVITVLNEGEGMARLLDALLDQTAIPDEIVVVDGGSADHTLEVLKRYADREGSPVRFWVEQGVNIARGRNIGIASARNEIVAVTDGGCRPERTWLEELTRPLKEDSSLGAVSGARRIDAGSRFEAFAGYLSTSRDSGDEKTRLFFGRSSAFRKSVWAAVGGYPEWLYTAEDTLFALRAKALGCRVAHAERSIVNWRPRPTLRKLARQYYLYGRGNGRINLGNVSASLYHLRNHALWVAGLAGSIAFPPAFLFTIFVLAYMYATMVVPVLRSVRKDIDDPLRELYVPLIVMTRSFFNNFGFMVGAFEYRHRSPFRENLEHFIGGEARSVSGRTLPSSGRAGQGLDNGQV